MENSYVYEMKADQKDYFYIFYYDISKDNPKADDMVHFHQSLEFVYVAEGSFLVHIQGISYTLKNGDIAYVRSGQIHYYTSLGDAKVFVFVVGVNYLNDPLLNGQCLLPVIMNLFAEKTEKMTSLLYSMYNIWEYGKVVLAKGIFYSFYGLLSEYIQNELTPASSRFPIYEILQYIDSHFTEHLTLKGLAAHFNYAETYFSSSFKANLNMSLREYINRIRIGHANQLIEKGMTKIQAAAACGYTSNNTFFRAYKKYCSKYFREVKDVTEVLSDNRKAQTAKNPMTDTKED